MTSDLLLHPKTRRQVLLVLKKPPQALLVLGLAGSGKKTLAKDLAAELLKLPAEKLDNYPYYTLLERLPGKQEIPIDSVRSVIGELSLKPVIGSKGLARRVVIINEAHFLSHEAQSALLKILEEPPQDTIFILTSTSDSAILPTIASRTQKLQILPASLDESEKYFAKNYKDKAIDSAWQLSQGAAGLLNTLLQDNSEHPLKIAVNDAKKLLGMNSYERLLYLDKLSANKEDFSMLLDGLNRILIVLHHSAIKSNNLSQTRKLAAGRELTGAALDSIGKNTSVRLIGLNLALRLPI